MQNHHVFQPFLRFSEAALWHVWDAWDLVKSGWLADSILHHMAPRPGDLALDSPHAQCECGPH
jgi:hypothetical protein